MALRKATKTIQLAAGMREDGDDFLVEPPALEYIENGRFDKHGVVSKRRGFEALPSNGLSSSDGTPGFLHAIGDNLYTISKDSVRRFDGSGWSSVQNAASLTGLSKVLETGGKRGLAHFDFVVTGSGNIVAVWELNGGVNNPYDKSVVIRSYDGDGTLIGETLLDNARCPKVTTGLTSQEAWVVYSPGTTATLVNLERRLYVSGTNTLGAAQTITTETVWTGMPIYGNTIHSPEYTANTIGFVWYEISTAPNGEHVLAYSITGNGVLNTDGRIVVRRFAEDWLTQQLSFTIGTGTVPVGGEQTRIPLAVLAQDDHHYLMYHHTSVDSSNAITVNEVVILRQVRANNVTTWSTNVYSNATERVAYHGTLALSGTLLFYAFYEDREGISVTNKREGGVTWGDLTASAGTSLRERKQFHHRLTTNAVVLNDEVYFGVQQFFDKTPEADYDRGAPGNVSGPFGSTRSIRPVSTYLVRADQVQQRLYPVAGMDLGRSAHFDSVDALATSHLTKLLVSGDNLRVANREVLAAEDVSIMYEFQNATTPANPPSVEPFQNVAAEATVNIYDVLFDVGTDLSASGFGDGVLISSSVPLWFDGERLLEATPLDQPEIVDIQQNATPDNNGVWESPSTTNTADYRKLAVVVGYYDRQGNLHRSAPSTTVYIYQGAINLDPTELIEVTFTAPLTLSQEERLFVELYMSETVSGDLRLRESKSIPIASTLIADYTVSFNPLRTIRAGSSHTLLVGSDFIYTTGGVLASDVWPPSKTSLVTSNRMWSISSEDKGTVFYSKLFEEFIAPEFNASLVISLGDERTLTALGELDDKVVVFEENKIHVIYGPGPDNTGRGGDFAVHRVQSDVGCIDRKSVVETPRGLVFLSHRGLHLLDRSLQVSFIGAPVEDMAEHIVVDAATLVPTEGEVRFVVRQDPQFSAPLETGPDNTLDLLVDGVIRPPRPKFSNVLPADAALVWNYEKNAWSVFSNYAGNAAVMYQNRYTRLRSDWSVWQESLDRWDDPSGDNLLYLITPWIKLGNMQDFARLWKITFVGRYLSSFRDIGGSLEAGDVGAIVTYDYEYPQTTGKGNGARDNRTIKVWRSNVHFQHEERDAGGAVGAPTNARAERLQFSLTPHRQKIQSVQIRINEEPTLDAGEGKTYVNGRGFEISAIDFEYGMHGGPNDSMGEGRKA